MIGKLSGIIDAFGEDHLILDVQGVGYKVYAGRRTLSSIGQRGDPAKLLIETYVREDAITLFGFATEAEQYWFRTLNAVQGVGTKAANAILSVCPAEELGFILASQDKAALTRADGVGPKLAARILTELKDKSGPALGASEQTSKPAQNKTGGGQSAEPAAQDMQHDAVSALVNLGYSRSEAYQAVLKVRDQANDNLQEIIRAALKELSA